MTTKSCESNFAIPAFNVVANSAETLSVFAPSAYVRSMPSPACNSEETLSSTLSLVKYRLVAPSPKLSVDANANDASNAESARPVV